MCWIPAVGDGGPCLQPPHTHYTVIQQSLGLAFIVQDAANHGSALRDTADQLAFLYGELEDFKAPLYDVPTALQLLETGMCIGEVGKGNATEARLELAPQQAVGQSRWRSAGCGWLRREVGKRSDMRDGRDCREWCEQGDREWDSWEHVKV